jgi:hypothetical protein
MPLETRNSGTPAATIRPHSSAKNASTYSATPPCSTIHVAIGLADQLAAAPVAAATNAFATPISSLPRFTEP